MSAAPRATGKGPTQMTSVAGTPEEPSRCRAPPLCSNSTSFMPHLPPWVCLSEDPTVCRPPRRTAAPREQTTQFEGLSGDIAAPRATGKGPTQIISVA